MCLKLAFKTNNLTPIFFIRRLTCYNLYHGWMKLRLTSYSNGQRQVQFKTMTTPIIYYDNVSPSRDIADQLHPEKCKVLTKTFTQNPVVLDPVIVNGKEIEILDNAKI